MAWLRGPHLLSCSRHIATMSCIGARGGRSILVSGIGRGAYSRCHRDALYSWRRVSSVWCVPRSQDVQSGRSPGDSSHHGSRLQPAGSGQPAAMPSARQPKEAREMPHTHNPLVRWAAVMALAPLVLACTGTRGGATDAVMRVAGTPRVQLVQVQQRGQAPVRFPSTVASPGGAAGPPPVGAEGSPPLGAAGPPPLDAAGPPPVGAVGPPPLDAAGPPPVGAAGSTRAPLAEPSPGRPSPVQPRRVR